MRQSAPPPWDQSFDIRLKPIQSVVHQSVLDRFFIYNLSDRDGRSFAKGESVYSGDKVEFDLAAITYRIVENTADPTPAPSI